MSRRKIVIVGIVLIGVFIFLRTSQKGIEQATLPGTSDEVEISITEEEKNNFLSDLHGCGFEGWDVHLVDLDGLDFISTNEKSCDLKFTVNKFDVINDGTRAELSRDYHDVAGTEVWYSWRFMIPEGYQDVTLKNDETGVLNWQIIGQWHEQAIPGGDYVPQSPPISLQYAYFDLQDPEYQRLIGTKDLDNVIGYEENMTDVSMLVLSYGLEFIPVAMTPITKGEWNDVVVHIKWSEESDGFIELMLNGASVTNGKMYGANMQNYLSHYLKIGLYRNPDIDPTNSVYFSDVKHGYSFDSVQ